MTDSADARLPRGEWTRTWLLAATLLLVVLGGWELRWRRKGWDATVEANQESWMIARGRLRPQSTVIAGTSRIQGALDPEAWVGAAGGDPPIELALAGASPLPVLEDLAADSSFHGVLLAELLPFYTFDASDRPERTTREYLRAFRAARHSPARRWEAWLRINIPSHFVFRRSKILPHQILGAMRSGDLDAPPESAQGPDRFHPIRFPTPGTPSSQPAPLDSGVLKRLRANTRPADDAQLRTLLARIATGVRRIESRGGRVYLIHLEACGKRRVVEDLLYPRARYWDRLAAMPGIRSIDSDDFPQAAGLRCHDGSHIDARDAAAVTRWLAQRVGPLRRGARAPTMGTTPSRQSSRSRIRTPLTPQVFATAPVASRGAPGASAR